MSTITNNALSTNLTNIYNRNQSYMAKALTQTASGQRIVSAKDGPSDWAISERMLERTYSLQQNKRNVQNGSAMLKTAEGGIQNTVDILTTIKERVLNAANAHNNADDIAIIQAEVDKLIEQVDTNVDNVKFNGKLLLDGSSGANSAASTTGTGSTGSTTPATVTYDFSNATKITLNAGAITDTTVKGLIEAANSSPSDNDVVQFSNIAQLASDTSGTAATGSAKYSSSFNSWALEGSSAVDVYYSNTQATPGGGGAGGGAGGGMSLQIGDEDGLTISFTIADMHFSALSGGATGLTVTDASALTTIDTALNAALTAGTNVGTAEQRLGYVSDNIDTQIENIENSYSTIREADMAKTVTDYMKYTILSQAAQFMLAQNNQNASSVFTLLQP